MLHSALPPRERLAAWRRLRAGEVGIALGARSAVFAPVRALGVVVVDEEHDPSFKQEEGVRYHGRDLAVRARAARGRGRDPRARRRRRWRAPTTSIRGRFARLVLPERATPRPLPAVDRRRSAPSSARARTACCRAPLADALGAALAAGEQSILFLNRRGFSTLLLCHAVRPRRALPELRGVDDLPPRPRRAWSATTAGACSTCPSAARRARRRGSSGWASAPSRSRRSCASASPTRAWRASIATRPATGRTRAAASHAILARMHARRDRRPGRHADGDQGPRLPGRHAGRRAASPIRR